jgi:hypothetical protein
MKNKAIFGQFQKQKNNKKGAVVKGQTLLLLQYQLKPLRTFKRTKERRQ